MGADMTDMCSLADCFIETKLWTYISSACILDTEVSDSWYEEESYNGKKQKKKWNGMRF